MATIDTNVTPVAPAKTVSAPTTPTVVTPTLLPTETLSPTPMPLFPLDGYVMVFTKDGDLYFQGGNNKPVQLTRGEKIPNSVLISDDNQKIIYYGNDGDIYTTNTDGSHQSVIALKAWLNSLARGAQRSALNFVPNTHLLIFETILCQTDDRDLPCLVSTFLANTDTGEIRKLAELGRILSGSTSDSDFSGSNFRNVKVSPDGTMLAVATVAGTDIFTLNGKLIRSKILPYKPSAVPSLSPALFWLPDSSGLVLGLPDLTYSAQACDPLPADSIWRYLIASNTSERISLVPPPMMHTFEVSPDGNWVVYGGYCQPSLYLGNLINGQTQILGRDGDHPNFFWGPDSRRLIIARYMLVTSLGKPPVILPGADNSQWIDPDHFISMQGFFRVAEIRDGEISYYETGLIFPPDRVITIRPKH